MKMIRTSIIFFSFLLASRPLSAQSRDVYTWLRQGMETGSLHPSMLLKTGREDTNFFKKCSFTPSGRNFLWQTPEAIMRMDTGQIRWQNARTGEIWTLDSLQWAGSSKKAQVQIGRFTGVVRIPGGWILQTSPGQPRISIRILSAGIWKLRLTASSGATGNWRVVFSGRGPFFGGGEHFLGTNLDGWVLTNQPRDHAWLTDSLRYLSHLRIDEPTYLPIPFIFSASGNGLYVDNAETVQLDLSHSRQKIFSAHIQDRQADLYLIFGPDPARVLTRYTSLMGRSPILPHWGLGVWVNLLKGYNTVVARAHELKQLGIPVDAVWVFDFDDPQSNTGWTYWTNGYYGNLRHLTDTLHRMGFKALTYLRPFVNRRLSYYDFANPIYENAQARHLIMTTSGLDSNYNEFHSGDQVNFFHPAVVSWWKTILTRNLVAENFDGWMEDFGDISYVYDKRTNRYTSWPYSVDTPFRNLPPEVRANIYPLIYHRLTYQLSKEIKPDMVSFSRSGSAGSAAFSPVIWGGDQDPSWDSAYGYPSAINAGISAGLSGYGVWAPDILCLSPSRELWMRWVEFGALCPLMRDHLWDDAPGNIRLWTDSGTLQFFKSYALLHRSLEPYLYQCAMVAHQTGLPIIRHLILEFPQDTTCWRCPFEYMLGDSILVAPVVEPHARVRRLYLPRGWWKFYWTNKIFKGGCWISVPAPVQEIPFFFRMCKRTLFSVSL
ncbi:MAG: glycoside hydrolase family 31 protein [Chitinophagaceae bacterium]